jgi:cellulose synthase/poly-beta-1,6-N-acetylglucosamine synthase-like glycosyltransferase
MNARRKPWCVGVIVPAHNEESSIEKCVETIFKSLSHARVARYWVVVVADGCTDRTADLAGARLGGRGEVLRVMVRSAGAARRAGAARVLAHFADVAPCELWMANTDADSHVAVDWISVQLSLADAGATGVAGIIRLDPEVCSTVQALHRATYRIDAGGTHDHVHGANLALRADAYLDVGGWNDLPLAEDHCLWERLRHRRWHVQSSVRSVVITSARLQGRAPGGFADTLRARLEASDAA